MATFLDATLGGQTFTTPKLWPGFACSRQFELPDVPLANPSINTVAGKTVVIGSGVTVHRHGRLSGGFNPTGTITFTLYNPSNVAVYTDVVTVDGAGTYTTAMRIKYGRLSADGHRRLPLEGRSGGDSNNATAADNGQNENEVVAPASPDAGCTTASFLAGSTTVVGSAIPEDSAVLSGGYNETGTITFTLNVAEQHRSRYRDGAR